MINTKLFLLCSDQGLARQIVNKEMSNPTTQLINTNSISSISERQFIFRLSLLFFK